MLELQVSGFTVSAYAPGAVAVALYPLALHLAVWLP